MYLEKRPKSNNIGFYLFWFIMLIFASLIVMFIYNKWYKINSFESMFTSSINGEDDSTDTIIIKSQSPQIQEDTFIQPAPSSPPPQSTIQENQDDLTHTLSPQAIKNDSEIMTLNTNTLKTSAPLIAPIFKDVILNSSSAYMNNSGTLYNAGYIYIMGTYPKDFLPYSSDAHPTMQVNIKVYVGWKNLKPLNVIEDINKKKATITLPPLQIFRTEITFPAKVFSKLKLHRNEREDTKKEISNAINEYVQNAFNEYQINKNTMLQAYKNLAKEYIARNYKNITVLPFKK